MRLHARAGEYRRKTEIIFALHYCNCRLFLPTFSNSKRTERRQSPTADPKKDTNLFNSFLQISSGIPFRTQFWHWTNRPQLSQRGEASRQNPHHLWTLKWWVKVEIRGWKFKEKQRLFTQRESYTIIITIQHSLPANWMFQLGTIVIRN